MTKIVPIIAVFLLLLPNGIQNNPIPVADHRRPESEMNSYTTETPPTRSETPETTVLGGDETSTEVPPRADPEITIIEGNTSFSGYTPPSETPDLDPFERTYSFLETFMIVAGAILAFALLLYIVLACWIHSKHRGVYEFDHRENLSFYETPVELLGMKPVKQDELPKDQSTPLPKRYDVDEIGEEITEE